MIENRMRAHDEQFPQISIALFRDAPQPLLAAGRVSSRRFPPRTGAGSGMGAVTARRFRDEGAAVVLTGRTREKLTKVVSQFDQERSLIHVSDMTKPDRRATRQCAPGLLIVRARLTTSNCRLSKFTRSIDPRTFADEVASKSKRRDKCTRSFWSASV